jgi:DNA-binding transcriptional LysR family regulator
MAKGKKNHNMPEIDLMDLRAFRAVLQEGSQSNAARKLEVSQPLISFRIQNVENFFQQQLIYRATSRMEAEATPIGKVLLDYTCKILDIVDEMIIISKGYK